MSRESGLPTFRGEGGIWNDYDFNALASASSWYCGRHRDYREKRQAMLDFFNPIRRMIMEHGPNPGHRIIAELEKDYEVTVITQNGDDYHSRAGSTDVIYLHGEALKNASTANPYIPLPINRENPDIYIGDKAPDGSQIRPFVIFFGENLDRCLWQRAVRAVKEADCLVVVGSSLTVFPAANLLRKMKACCRLVMIDPAYPELSDRYRHPFSHIIANATAGLQDLTGYLEEWGKGEWNMIADDFFDLRK